MSQHINKVVSQFEESIFSTMSRLSQENSAVNLSQGFPDFQGPEWIRNYAAQLITDPKHDHNQYAPAAGVPELLSALSEMMKDEYSLDYEAQTQITITNGATEALFLCAQALFNPGDEILVFEPFYDSYLACIQLAGLVPKIVTLHSPDFKFDADEVQKMIGPKTKGLFWNDPHNPTGRVFTSEEKKQLKEVILRNNLVAVCDHVYEFLTFDENQFRPLAFEEDIKDQVVHISSAGKTFGLTGWKVGWAMTSPELTKALLKVHQFNTFCVSPPFQKTIAYALKNRKSYLNEFRQNYLAKRNYFTKGLEDIGLQPYWSQGTYFTLCPIPAPGMNDVDFCRKLIQEYKVSAIPPSAFYLKSNEGHRYVRFCFAKKQETLELALKLLKGLSEKGKDI